MTFRIVPDRFANKGLLFSNSLSSFAHLEKRGIKNEELDSKKLELTLSRHQRNLCKRRSLDVGPFTKN